MSADVLPFPAAPRLGDPPAGPRLTVGDIVVVCINATLSLWCAFPVALVDDDGVVLAIANKAGRVIGVDRVNCVPDVYGFASADHMAEAFAHLRWRTFRDPADAVLAFAFAGVAAPS